MAWLLQLRMSHHRCICAAHSCRSCSSSGIVMKARSWCDSCNKESCSAAYMAWCCCCRDEPMCTPKGKGCKLREAGCSACRHCLPAVMQPVRVDVLARHPAIVTSLARLHQPSPPPLKNAQPLNDTPECIQSADTTCGHEGALHQLPQKKGTANRLPGLTQRTDPSQHGGCAVSGI